MTHAPKSPHSLSIQLWPGVLTADEIDAVVAYGDRVLQEAAEVGRGISSSVRVTRIAWLEHNADTNFFYHRIAQVVHELNRRAFHFDVTGLEKIQYSVYKSSEGGHYDWHIDTGPENPKPRKLSMSIQLTDPSTYAGCDLQFQVAQKVDVAPRERGTCICFPSFFRHRVTPITSGTRRALVAWASGPEFR